jgi:hypothetical protein
MRRLTIAVALLTMTPLLACARQEPAAPSPLREIATNKQIMNAMIVPSSNAVFNVTAEEPKNDDDWMGVQNQAIVLAESGNLLMIGNRIQDDGDWITFSQAFIDASQATLKAAESENVDAVSLAGDKLLETCSLCHDKYMKPPATN